MDKECFVLGVVFLLVTAQGVFASEYTVTNTSDSGPGSLRQAILYANANPGTDMIIFNIPTTDPGYNHTTGAFTIQPLSFLPNITDAVIIDGYTQPGASYNTNPPNLGTNAVLKIELDGTYAGSGGSGITVSSGGSGSKVRGLVINRFRYHGIYLGFNSSNNVIEGNFIGTDVTGTIDIGNSGSGIVIFHSSNLIGGMSESARNIISGNSSGVDINGSVATGNLVQGNLIGTDADGTDILYGTVGVRIYEGASNNIIINNIISGHNSWGIDIEGSGTTGNKVKGNLIGTDVSGTIALGNGNGIRIFQASNNTIGGIISEARNIISGNNFNAYSTGIEIQNGADNNIVQGNFIGTDINGNALGNASHGIFIGANANNNDIGFNNTIAYNIGDGVFVISGTGNAILSNSIFANAGLGIDLGSSGVTPNDVGDGDGGANNQQNFPVLNSATAGGGNITIDGTLNSTPNSSFRLEFFANSASDPSGHGEGEIFLGSAIETTNGSGNVSFAVTTPVEVPPGQFISATATDPDNNTSEFSECIAVVGIIPATVDVKPQSCPNPLNVRSGGVLPVAILGREDFDVSTIDPASILLEGVAPIRDSLQDVATPVVIEDPCDCTDEGPDGFDDFTFKFDMQEIVAALGEVHDGDIRILTITGELTNGTQFEGEDCVVIIAGGEGPQDGGAGLLPLVFDLADNIPNPCRGFTLINYQLPSPVHATLKIYDISGRLVRTLVDESKQPGYYAVSWDGKDSNDSDLANGIYFYRLEAGDFTEMKKMVLVR
ncbi:MAG: T9SS type A sorting domain-containing protein [candidate division WOR-3 bacterium]|nr:MAG: T9SS type A sorting domain-containing protein [candidate division WOR-3 bacterium]